MTHDDQNMEREDLQEQIPAESTLSADQFHTLMAMDPVATVVWKPPSESDEREWADAMQTIPARRSVIVTQDDNGDAGSGKGQAGGGLQPDQDFKLHTLDSVAPTEYVDIVDPDEPIPDLDHGPGGGSALNEAPADAGTMTVKGGSHLVPGTSTDKRVAIDPAVLAARLKERESQEVDRVPQPADDGSMTVDLPSRQTPPASAAPGAAPPDMGPGDGSITIDLPKSQGSAAPAPAEFDAAGSETELGAVNDGPAKSDQDSVETRGPFPNGPGVDSLETRIAPPPGPGAPMMPSVNTEETRLAFQAADVETGGQRSTRGKGTRPISPRRASALSMAAANTDFVLRRKIGAGGQGEVWRAWQSSLCREVAVKTLKSGDVTEFLQESYTSGELDHPNIVPVYDLGRVHDGQREVPLLAMKLVRGTPWNDLIARDRKAHDISTEAFLAKHLGILVDVCNAVAYAHSKGIIHRDLKPQQVMVGDYGEVFLMDWGLAISINEEVPIAAREGMPKFRTLGTATNRCGSPAYMAPEQTHESTEKLGLWTDVYLLGAILFELVTGRPPHAAQSAQGAYFMAVVNECNLLPKSAPLELRELIEMSLATEPEQRPQTVVAFRGFIEDYMSGAGRRRESIELTQDVADEIELIGESELGYGELTLLSQNIARALQLWEDNPQAKMMRARLYGLHAERAVDAGDLELARTMANWVTDEGRKKTLFERIDIEEARQKTAARERRVFQIASIVLVILAIAVYAVFSIRNAETEAERAKERDQRILEQQRLELIRERGEEAVSQSARIEAIYNLTVAEDALAEELQRSFPSPDSLSADPLVTLRFDRDRADALLAQVEGLEERRAEIVAQLDGGGQNSPVYLKPAPPALLTARARIALASATMGAEMQGAYDAYTTALAESPDVPQLMLGAGITAWRAGNVSAAMEHFADAHRQVGATRAASDSEFALAIALERAAAALPDALQRSEQRRRRYVLAEIDPNYGDLLRALQQRLGDAATGSAGAAGPGGAPSILSGDSRADNDASLPSLLRLGMDQERGGHRDAALATYGELVRTGESRGDETDAALAAWAEIARFRLRLDAGASVGLGADASRMIDRAVAQFGNQSPLLSDALILAGEEALRRSDYPAAVAFHRQALAIRTALFSPSHHAVVESRALLAEVLALQGDATGAAVEYRTALRDAGETIPATHPITIAIKDQLAVLLMQVNRSEALSLRRELVESLGSGAGGGPRAAIERLRLAAALVALGDQESAQQQAEEARATLRAMPGAAPDAEAIADDLLGVIQQAQQRARDARGWHAASLAVRSQRFGHRHPLAAVSLLHLADSLAASRETEGAALLRNAALSILRDQLGDDTPLQLPALNALLRSVAPGEALPHRLLSAMRRACLAWSDPLPIEWWRGKWMESEMLMVARASELLTAGDRSIRRDQALAVWKRAAIIADLVRAPSAMRDDIDRFAVRHELTPDERRLPEPPPTLAAGRTSYSPMALLEWLDGIAIGVPFDDLFAAELRGADLTPMGPEEWSRVDTIIESIRPADTGS